MSRNLEKIFCSSEEMESECWIISNGYIVGDVDGGVLGTLVDVETSLSPKSMISSCFSSKSKVEEGFGFLCSKINSFMISLACGSSSLTLFYCLLPGTGIYTFEVEMTCSYAS